MVNSWSLLYDEMYGPDDEANAVKWKKEKLEKDPEYVKWRKDNPDKSYYYFEYDRNDPDMPKPFGKDLNLDLAMNDDQIAHHIQTFGDDPYPTLGSIEDRPLSQKAVDEVYAHHFPGTDNKPKPNFKGAAVQKYHEDEGIKDLKDYVASTYSGHYTNQGSNVQTLDLIHSVGDAESFCRSNAIKYLSRYDKKGQAKRDILKAMHYCLLLYYFSGNANNNNETPTNGYETF